MNILFINNIPFNPTLGGIERVTDVLTKKLLNIGYNVYYLSGNIQESRYLDYEFPTKMNIFPESGLFSSNVNVLFYKDFVKSNNIDIIINQKGLDHFLNKSLEIENVIKITVLHSMPKAYLKYSCKNIFSSNLKLKDVLKNIIKFLFYPLFYLRCKYKGNKKLSSQYNYLVKKSDAVVLLSSKYVDEFLSCKIKNHTTPILGIPNPNTFEGKNIKIDKKEKIILYVGRLNKFAKQPQRLLLIWQKIHHRHLDWRLYFVGDGDALNNMKNYQIQYNIPRVYFEGKSDNVSGYYQKASVICLTSDFEGWPMTITEGMTYGCIPFVFNSFLAASDIIDNEINGFLIPPYSLRKYANKLEKVMNDDHYRSKLSYEAMCKIKKFDITEIILKWEELFQNLIKNKSK